MIWLFDRIPIIERCQWPPLTYMELQQKVRTRLYTYNLQPRYVWFVKIFILRQQYLYFWCKL